ncbi:Uncharacterised protein [Vibrio cholerae]|uniref:Uncharacterized protein n=1 Tax=Vibrio cholerae TaxID=666 RepID=A0A656AJQ9_VIBCL|nr:Uncharacterised protein [Vibrio cholerae]CRZ51840.1 Uncharacterised protein [Vibrio cholerae]CRZ52849.1 Uncharacterised protein [Vibrio cholerae]CSA54901.1 Uncharacterised protein [Vibrio cholerae]CSA59773.1 Uncharacterised protein [Vibrio cholerae]
MRLHKSNFTFQASIHIFFYFCGVIIIYLVQRNEFYFCAF